MQTGRVMLGAMLLGLLPGLMPGLALPARADGLFFGFSSGPSYKRHHDRYDRHRPPPHAYRSYGYRPYAYRETWIYSDPYPRYYPPARYAPQVYMAPPPVYQQPSMEAMPASPVYRTAQGQYCREYQSMIQVQGMMQPSFGTACLMPDGVWRIVN